MDETGHDEQNEKPARPDEANGEDAEDTGATQDRDDIRRDDEAVEQASEDSFPASDPPSYSGTTGGSSGDED